MYDVAVIGGGPAGMFAAINAAAQPKKVILIEKNAQLGKKLLLTGKGRCNITNACQNKHEFIGKYGPQGKFLYSAFSKFGPAEVISFFESRGLSLKEERGQRIFPTTDKASSVLNVLQKELQKSKVVIKTKSGVKKIVFEQKQVAKIILEDDTEIMAKNYILATGGLSYPATGSTGQGFDFARELGHTVTPLKPCLVPIMTKEPWTKVLAGLSLKNVTVAVFVKNKKVASKFGECLFTHQGLSGPIILDLSKKIGDLLVLNPGDLSVKIDLKPALDHETLDLRLQSDFKKYQNKNLINALPDLLPKKLISIIVRLSKLSPSKKVHQLSKFDRKILGETIKALPLTIHGLGGFETAIITGGGISLKEIEPQTMGSKIFKNLYFCGEMLDLDGPSGGYNLQICWSTGFVAGQNAALSSNKT